MVSAPTPPAFAGLAVLMVVTGLYGVLARLVSYRRREIGVRLALGSTRSAILARFVQCARSRLANGSLSGSRQAAS